MLMLATAALCFHHPLRHRRGGSDHGDVVVDDEAVDGAVVVAVDVVVDACLMHLLKKQLMMMQLC